MNGELVEKRLLYTKYSAMTHEDCKVVIGMLERKAWLAWEDGREEYEESRR